ncbi:MAG: response regulator [Rhodocyclales bacterium]|nr:response regulator [Rhodocyclales bacterium]
MSARKILVVEDNPINMQLMQAILSRCGHVVLQAEDAQAGLDLARRERPALIFMDIQLPGMDGLAATRLLKDDPDTRAIPVVAVTAFAMKGDRERILAAGCDDYLSKPVSYRDVLEMAARLMG